MGLLKNVTEKLGQYITQKESEAALHETPGLLESSQWEQAAKQEDARDRYLIDENCLLVSPTLAAVFGIPGAIVLQQVHYFVTINQQRETAKSYYKNGHYWMYAALCNWQAQLPFLSVATIKRVLHDLDKVQHVLVRRQTRKDNHPQTFYRVDYQQLALRINSYQPKPYQKEILRNARYNEKLGSIQEFTNM